MEVPHLLDGRPPSDAALGPLCPPDPDRVTRGELISATVQRQHKAQKAARVRTVRPVPRYLDHLNERRHPQHHRVHHSRCRPFHHSLPPVPSQPHRPVPLSRPPRVPPRPSQHVPPGPRPPSSLRSMVALDSAQGSNAPSKRGCARSPLQTPRGWKGPTARSGAGARRKARERQQGKWQRSWCSAGIPRASREGSELYRSHSNRVRPLSTATKMSQFAFQSTILALALPRRPEQANDRCARREPPRG